jgi:hypothetical protein
MPTPVTAKFLKPKDALEFENLVRDVLARRWRAELHLNGRSGQKQYGVDIFGERNGGIHTGVQCKNVDALSMAAIQAEVSQAESFTPYLVEYWIVTSVERDAVLQGEVRELSAKRVAQGKFRVSILFWQDIECELAGHPDLVEKYYGSLKTDDSRARQVKQRALELVRVENIAAKSYSGSDAIVGCRIPLKDDLDIESAYSLKGDPRVYAIDVDEPQRMATIHMNRTTLPDDWLRPDSKRWPFS